MCGPFGCGKTRTLRECIVLMLLHQPSAKMLICTHSNSAADLYVEDISREWNSEIYMCIYVYVYKLMFLQILRRKNCHCLDYFIPVVVIIL